MRKQCSNVCKFRPCLATESTNSVRMRTIVTAALQRQYSQTELIFGITLVFYLFFKFQSLFILRSFIKGRAVVNTGRRTSSVSRTTIWETMLYTKLCNITRILDAALCENGKETVLELPPALQIGTVIILIVVNISSVLIYMQINCSPYTAVK